MTITELAIAIVAGFAGGGAYFGAERLGAGAWLAFALGVLVTLVVLEIAPLVLG